MPSFNISWFTSCKNIYSIHYVKLSDDAVSTAEDTAKNFPLFSYLQINKKSLSWITFWIFIQVTEKPTSQIRKNFILQSPINKSLKF